MKYLVIADTYNGGYGCEYTLFGIFDTEEEAVKWIINNPRVCIAASESDEEDQYEEYFDFFEDYDEERGGIYRRLRNSQFSDGFVPMTKEEYILSRCRYIRRFNGEPTWIGGYQE